MHQEIHFLVWWFALLTHQVLHFRAFLCLTSGDCCCKKNCNLLLHAFLLWTGSLWIFFFWKKVLTLFTFGSHSSEFMSSLPFKMLFCFVLLLVSTQLENLSPLGKNNQHIYDGGQCQSGLILPPIPPPIPPTPQTRTHKKPFHFPHEVNVTGLLELFWVKKKELLTFYEWHKARAVVLGLIGVLNLDSAPGGQSWPVDQKSWKLYLKWEVEEWDRRSLAPPLGAAESLHLRGFVVGIPTTLSQWQPAGVSSLI